jgi:MFS family permease
VPSLLKRLTLRSGNVKILGAGTKNSLEHTLHLKGTEFNWAVSITYFAVTAGLLPANIAMKKYSAKLFLPVIMILWGAVVLAIAGVNNATGLLAARFFLGIPEAAVVPSCIMYFGMWYKPSERAFRIAIFHAWNCVASAVSSFLASGIGKMEGVGGLHAWQW